MARQAAYTAVVITDSFTDEAYHAHLPADMRRTFNEQLPPGAIGVSWSNDGGNYGTLIYVGWGDGNDTSKRIPLVNHESGKIHNICPFLIHESSTARNIVVHY